MADFYRRQKRAAKGQSESQENAVELVQDNDSKLAALSTVGSERTRQAVQETLSSLPYQYRQVLILKYVEEMPVSEISQIMSRSPKSIEGLLTRARKKLRPKLTTQSEG